MAEVSPDGGAKARAGGPGVAVRVLGDRLEVTDSLGGDDCCELGVHGGVPSIAFNVISRID